MLSFMILLLSNEIWDERQQHNKQCCQIFSMWWSTASFSNSESFQIKWSIAQWVRQRIILKSESKTWNELNINSNLNWFQKQLFLKEMIKNIKFLKFLMWLKKEIAMKKKLNSVFIQNNNAKKILQKLKSCKI